MQHFSLRTSEHSQFTATFLLMVKKKKQDFYLSMGDTTLSFDFAMALRVIVTSCYTLKNFPAHLKNKCQQIFLTSGCISLWFTHIFWLYNSVVCSRYSGLVRLTNGSSARYILYVKREMKCFRSRPLIKCFKIE